VERASRRPDAQGIVSERERGSERYSDPRPMKLHEYQSKDLLERFGVPVPRGDVAQDPASALAIARSLGGRVVVKAQVLMGGRGKAGGVRLVQSAEEAADFTKELIGKRLVSIQNPQGLVVERVLVAEVLEIAEEYYVAVLLDRDSQRFIVMVSPRGGMDIEDVAAKEPGAIQRIEIDPAWGIWGFQIRNGLERAGFRAEVRGQLASLISKLVRAAEETDAELIEINPCALTKDGKIVCADAKVAIEDSALFRHAELAQSTDVVAEDQLEAEAARRGIAYVRLKGEIGIIGNGAGLVMCSMDEVQAAGGRPANFLDVGGGAQAERVKSCMELVLMDPAVKGLLINIFGGITRCDEVAKGVLDSLNELGVDIPVVARIEGTAADEGRRLLSGSRIVPAETMREAAVKIVELVSA
jgi:succinyl-CoA synthetase beta subunit